MKKIKTLLFISIAISLALTLINFIPEFNIARIIFYALSYILILIYIIKLWRGISKNSNTSKNIFLTVFKSLSFLIIIPAILAFVAVALAFTQPYFTDKIKLDSHTFYVYEEDCFPSSIRGCRNFYMDVYQKNNYLPIMHHLIRLDYYADSLYINDNKLFLKASDKYREVNIGKIKSVPLK